MTSSAFDQATNVIDDISGDYTIDPSHSRLGFSARHAMVATVRGQFSEFTGSAHVDTADPTHLFFEYLRRIGHVADAFAPAGAPVRALHLGGGALTLPRYLAATRPGSAPPARPGSMRRRAARCRSSPRRPVPGRRAHHPRPCRRTSWS